MPGAEHDSHEANTAALDVLFNDIISILSNEWDPAAGTLAAAHPDFAAQWELSREIGQPLGRRTRALEVHVADSTTNAPLSAALITFTDGPATIKSRRTAAGGGIHEQTMAEGQYKMHVSLPGYTEQTRQITIIGGQMTLVTIALEKM